MTLQYTLIGKPGNIEEAVSEVRHKGNKVYITPKVISYLDVNGRLISISYSIKLQIMKGVDLFTFNQQELGELGTSELEVIINILEKAIEIGDTIATIAKDKVNATINGKESQGLRTRIMEYKNMREEMKKGHYSKPLVLKTRDTGRELVDLAKKEYINYNSRKANLFRDVVADFYAYLRGVSHHT